MFWECILLILVSTNVEQVHRINCFLFFKQFIFFKSILGTLSHVNSTPYVSIDILSLTCVAGGYFFSVPFFLNFFHIIVFFRAARDRRIAQKSYRTIMLPVFLSARISFRQTPSPGPAVSSIQWDFCIKNCNSIQETGY